MSPQVALLFFLLYILCLYAKDINRRSGLSLGLWAVVFWVTTIGSRPISAWLSFHLGSATQLETYDEGNPLERMVYFAFIFYGVATLIHRKVPIGELIRTNRWLVFFCLYWAVSVMWADSPFLAFKRWIKDAGNIVMVLIVLTEKKPIEAIKAVFVRCACLLVPLSVLLIHFYSELGRTYHIWTGELMFTGVTTHKSSLGMLVLVCGLFLLWDILDRLGNRFRPRDWIGLVGDVSLMTMTLWLLLKANSATALGCAIVGVIIFFCFGLRAVRKRAKQIEISVVVTGILLWVLNPVFDFARFVVVDIAGRDLTLTTRTEVWPILLAMQENMLLGTGFNSFWSSERLATIYNKLGIIQAHNGYLETYLNGGVLAIVLLVCLLVSAIKTINRELMRGSDYARIRLTILIVTIIYNFTEAAFNKMGIIWFAFLLVIVQYRLGVEKAPRVSRKREFELQRTEAGIARRAEETAPGIESP